MSEVISSNRKTKNIQKIIRSVVILYFAAIIGLGVMYALKSKGGNIATILSYFGGMRGFPNDALIYTSILEAVFITLAMVGSLLSIIMLFSSSWKFKVIPLIMLFSTAITYILSRIALIQATIHLSTQGAIKNIEVWDMQMIFSQILGSSIMVRSIALLLIGSLLIPILLYIDDRVKVLET